MPAVSQNNPPSIILYIISGCMAGLFLCLLKNGCNEPNLSSKIIEQRIDTVTTVDTTYITKHKIVYKTKFHYDSILVRDTVLINLCEYERIYNDTVKDSLLTIITTDTVIGELKSHKINYSYALPTIAKTTTIRDSVFVEAPKIPRWHRLNNARVAAGGFLAGLMAALGTAIYLTK